MQVLVDWPGIVEVGKGEEEKGGGWELERNLARGTERC